MYMSYNSILYITIYTPGHPMQYLVNSSEYCVTPHCNTHLEPSRYNKHSDSQDVPAYPGIHVHYLFIQNPRELH
jgi:hypothetical protein